MARDIVGLAQNLGSSLASGARQLGLRTREALAPLSKVIAEARASDFELRPRRDFGGISGELQTVFRVGDYEAPDEEPIDLEEVKRELDALAKSPSFAGQGKRVLSYDAARHLIFSKLDNRDGVVTCVYTGRELRTNGIPDGRNMNTEHTWPQSKGAKGDAKSDIHHLFPTDSETNARRGSHPFGEITGAPVWERGGSKLGRDEHGNTVFQPREVHRGNVARALFYFSETYKMPIPESEERWLRKWDKEDSVDAAETAREKAITDVQGLGNRFVTDPAAADSVEDF